MEICRRETTRQTIWQDIKIEGLRKLGVRASNEIKLAQTRAPHETLVRRCFSITAGVFLNQMGGPHVPKDSRPGRYRTPTLWYFLSSFSDTCLWTKSKLNDQHTYFTQENAVMNCCPLDLCSFLRNRFCEETWKYKLILYTIRPVTHSLSSTVSEVPPKATRRYQSRNSNRNNLENTA
jgi:hypothetical protein